MKKFATCCTLYQEVRDWVDDCTQLLSQFIIDAAGENIDTLRVQLEVRNSFFYAYSIIKSCVAASASSTSGCRGGKGINQCSPRM